MTTRRVAKNITIEFGGSTLRIGRIEWEEDDAREVKRHPDSVISDDDDDAGMRTTFDRRVLEVLADGRVLSLSAIARAIGRTNADVASVERRRMYALEKSGVLENTPNGWRISKKR